MNGARNSAEALNRKDAMKQPHLYNVACYDQFSNMILRCYLDPATAAKELSLSVREINMALLKGANYAGIKWGYIHVNAKPKRRQNGYHELRQIISIAAFEASVSKTGSSGRLKQETRNFGRVNHPTATDTFEDEIIFPVDEILDNVSNASSSSTANTTRSERSSTASGDSIVEDSIVYWMDLSKDRDMPEPSNKTDDENEVQGFKNVSRHSKDSHSDVLTSMKLSNASRAEVATCITSDPIDNSMPQNRVLSRSQRSFPFYEPDPLTVCYGSHFISREKPYYLRNALGFRLIVEAVQAMTPESLDGKKDMINVSSIYQQIRMTHYDFFGGVTLKLSLITPLIQHVIKECLTLDLFARVSKKSTFPHSYVATKKGLRLDTTDIFPYNLVMTLSDLQQSALKAGRIEQPPQSAPSSSKSSSSSSSRANGSDVTSTIGVRTGTGTGTGNSSSDNLNGRRLSSRFLIDKDGEVVIERDGDRDRNAKSMKEVGREKDGDRNTKSIKEVGRERDRLAMANVISTINSRKGMDMGVEADAITEIVWADQGLDEEHAQERMGPVDNGDKLKVRKDISYGASGKSSDESREKKILPVSSFDLKRKMRPTFLKLGSVMVERSSYSHLSGALGCRIVFETIRDMNLNSDPQEDEEDADKVPTTTSILDYISEKYKDSVRRESPFMSIAVKIIHKAKKQSLVKIALKSLLSDKLVDKRPSAIGRSYIYFLLKKGKKLNVEKLFPYDIRKTLDFLMCEDSSVSLDKETAKKYLSSHGDDVDTEKCTESKSRTDDGANISGPSSNKRKGGEMRLIDRVVESTSTSASNGHHNVDIGAGKRRRDSEFGEGVEEVDKNGSREGRNTVDAHNASKSTLIPGVSRRVALTPAERAAKAERIMSSDQPYGRVALGDIALFFVTGALGCRLVMRALQVLTTYHTSSPGVGLIQIYSYLVTEHFSEFYQDVLLQFKLVDVRAAMTFALKRLESLCLISCSRQHTKLYKITIAGNDCKPHSIYRCGPLKQFLQNAYEMRGGVRVGKGHEQPDGEMKAQEEEDEEDESEEEDCSNGVNLDREENSEHSNVEGDEVEEDDDDYDYYDDGNDDGEREQSDDDKKIVQNNRDVQDKGSDAPIQKKVVKTKVPGPPATSSDRRSRSSSGRHMSTMLEQALGTKVNVPRKKQKKDSQWLTASDEGYAKHNDEMLDEFLSGCSESSEYFPKRDPESHSRFMADLPDVSDCPVEFRHLRDSAEERSGKALLSRSTAEGEDTDEICSNTESRSTDGLENGDTTRPCHSEDFGVKPIVESWEHVEYSHMDVEEVTVSTPPILRADRSPEDEANLLTLLKQCHAVVCLPGSVIQVRPKDAPLMYVCLLDAQTKAVSPTDNTLLDSHASTEGAPHSVVESESSMTVEDAANLCVGIEAEQDQQNTSNSQLHSSSKISMETESAARDGDIIEDVKGKKEVSIVTAGTKECPPSQQETERLPEEAIVQHPIADITPHSPINVPIVPDYLVAFDGAKKIGVLLADCRPLLGEDGILSVLREHACTTVEDATPHLVNAVTALLMRQWDVVDIKDYVRLFKRFDGELNKMYKKSPLLQRKSMKEIIDFHEYFLPLLESRESYKMQWLFTKAHSKNQDPDTIECIRTDRCAKSSSSKSHTTVTDTDAAVSKRNNRFKWHKEGPAGVTTLPQLREAVTAQIADHTKSEGSYYIMPRLMPLLAKAGWLKVKAKGMTKVNYIIAPWVAKPVAEGGVMCGQEIDLKASRESSTPGVVHRDYYYDIKRLLAYLTHTALFPLDQLANVSTDSADVLTIEGSEPDRDVNLATGWESLETPRNSLLMACRNTGSEDVVEDVEMESDGGDDGDPMDDSDDSDNDRVDDDEYYRQLMNSSSNSSVSGSNSSSSSSSSSRKFDPPVVSLDEDGRVVANGGRYRGGISGDQSDVSDSEESSIKSNSRVETLENDCIPTDISMSSAHRSVREEQASKKMSNFTSTRPDFPRHTRIPFVEHVNANAIFKDHYIYSRFLKPVVQVDLSTSEVINVYPSGKAAATIMGTRQSGISLCCTKRIDSLSGYAWKFYKGPPIDWAGTEVIEIQIEQSPPCEESKPQKLRLKRTDRHATSIEQQMPRAQVLLPSPTSAQITIAEYWRDCGPDVTEAIAFPSGHSIAGATVAAANANQHCSSSSSRSASMRRDELSCTASGADTVAESGSSSQSATAGSDDPSTCPSSPSSTTAIAHAGPDLYRPRLIKKRNRSDIPAIIDKVTQGQGIELPLQISGGIYQGLDKEGVVVKSYTSSRHFRTESNLRFAKIKRAIEGKQATAYGLKWRYVRSSEEDQDAAAPLPKAKRIRLRKKAVLNPVPGAAVEETDAVERSCTAPIPVSLPLETGIGAESEDLTEMTERNIGVELEPDRERSGEEGVTGERKTEGESERHEQSGVDELEEGTERESGFMSLVNPGEKSLLSDATFGNSSSLDDYSHILDHTDGMSVDSTSYSRALRAISDIGFTEFDHDCMVQEDLVELGFSDAHFTDYVT